ncbi:hypothetical protein BpHYR1_041531 [Brachionus plicatilis]|uniref:Uncharacterized protein n=1 Tax=Brachionus plicatilis TaxID=10195 RepID=A0A3M7Q1W7_BRAPC|nr:hypothetical protein BpHYR1_041531 [Brachionus plicatilis]
MLNNARNMLNIRIGSEIKLGQIKKPLQFCRKMHVIKKKIKNKQKINELHSPKHIYIIKNENFILN